MESSGHQIPIIAKSTWEDQSEPYETHPSTLPCNKNCGPHSLKFQLQPRHNHHIKGHVGIGWATARQRSGATIRRITLCLEKSGFAPQHHVTAQTWPTQCVPTKSELRCHNRDTKAADSPSSLCILRTHRSRETTSFYSTVTAATKPKDLTPPWSINLQQISMKSLHVEHDNKMET